MQSVDVGVYYYHFKYVINWLPETEHLGIGLVADSRVSYSEEVLFVNTGSEAGCPN
jgi:hypothetical protein